jgi:DNA-binding transcriptional LysR family regulator
MTFGTFHRRCAPGELAIILSHFEEVKSEIHLLIYQRQISQLRAFVAIARHQNFSAAALELGVSQSTISHAIATLETELGILLLNRGRHGAVLTPEGKQVLPEAQQVLELLDTMRQKADQFRRFQSGQVRVASVRSVATHVLPEVIAQFCQKYPTMSVAVLEFDRYREVEQALRDGRAEIGFTSLPTSTEFQVWELFRDQFVALLPPKTLAPDVPLDWETLVSFPAILNHRSHQHNKLVRDHLQQFGYALKEQGEVREDSTILGMIQQGLGVTVMTRLAAEPIPPGIQVRELPVPLERIIGVAILAEALLPRSAFAFLDVLKTVGKEAR